MPQGWDQVTFKHWFKLVNSKNLSRQTKFGWTWMLVLRWLFVPSIVSSIVLNGIMVQSTFYDHCPPTIGYIAGFFMFTVPITLLTLVIGHAIFFKKSKMAFVYIILFVVLNPAYLLLQFCMILVSLFTVCTKQDVTWHVTTRSMAGKKASSTDDTDDTANDAVQYESNYVAPESV